MRIGIDFDNTIACYDGVFHRAAVARGLVPQHIGTGKNDVRDYLNGSGQKDAFTELQGYVYGSRMDLVSPYQGVGAFLSAALSAGHELAIVSHKTRFPLIGERYDMHESARKFLVAHGFVGADAVREADVFFEPTKDAKVARATALGCTAFIDDLPEIVTMMTDAGIGNVVLFDPSNEHGARGARRARTWTEIGEHFGIRLA